MLPHLRERPLMMERHPDGTDGGAFLQKELPDHFPDRIHRAELPKADGTVTYAVCDDAPTLVYLADQACTTLHRFLSRTDRPSTTPFDQEDRDERPRPARPRHASARSAADAASRADAAPRPDAETLGSRARAVPASRPGSGAAGAAFRPGTRPEPRTVAPAPEGCGPEADG